MEIEMEIVPDRQSKGSVDEMVVETRNALLDSACRNPRFIRRFNDEMVDRISRKGYSPSDDYFTTKSRDDNLPSVNAIRTQYPRKHQEFSRQIDKWFNNPGTSQETLKTLVRDELNALHIRPNAITLFVVKALKDDPTLDPDDALKKSAKAYAEAKGNYINQNMRLIRSAAKAACSKLRNKADRKDVISASRLETYRALDSFNPDFGCALSTYVFSTVFWHAKKVLRDICGIRNNKDFVPTRSLNARVYNDDDAYSLADIIVDACMNGESAFKAACLNEEFGLVYEAVRIIFTSDEYTDRQRQNVELFLIEKDFEIRQEDLSLTFTNGMKNTEIAGLLHTTPQNASQRRKNGEEILRDVFCQLLERRRSQRCNERQGQ